MHQPSCFVIMPFGNKKYKPRGASDSDLIEINFNIVYETLIKPGIIKAGMDPIRADEETVKGSIHKPMFERIILSDYVVADLTGANANVFYEMGVRHAVKPFTTISIFADNCDLPFDLAAFRTIPYSYSKDHGIKNSEELIQIISRDLAEAKTNKTTDSPIYQLVDGINFQNSVAHEKTDIFRSRVDYNNALKNALKIARQTSGEKKEKIKAIDDIIKSMILPLENQETGVLIDAMLSYRDVSAFDKMESFIEQLPPHVRQTVMVQEQYGFALNRNKKREKAIEVLEKVITENGPSSETYGLLGRVYKDYILENYERGDMDMANSYLEDAINAYRKGFEADWRDAYPGINYVTCLELKGNKDILPKIIPVVEYAVFRKKEKKKPDYWDEATLFELAIIENAYDKASKLWVEAKKKQPVSWMIDTTKNNVTMIRNFRERRGEKVLKLNELMNKISG